MLQFKKKKNCGIFLILQFKNAVQIKYRAIWHLYSEQ